ncbi:rDNA transcriptional regulator pol5 [Halotydeus destructor]|nr:rDNA transcriptional regulator pol5 [Halotydeus destructor]
MVQTENRDKPFKGPLVSQQLLDSFWLISDASDQRRLQGCTKILAIVAEDSAAGDGKSLEYCVQRLVKGMSSSRQFARRGFSVLLTELLQLYPVEIGKVLKCAHDNLENYSKTEAPNAIGWLMVVMSIVNSGRMLGNIGKKEELQIYDIIYKLGKTKEYLEIPTMEFLQAAVTDQLLNVDAFAKHILPQLFEKTPKDGPQSLHSLFLYVFLHNVRPNLQTIDFVLEDHYTTLDALTKSASGSLPHLHPTLKELVKAALKKGEICSFWKSVIEKAFFVSGCGNDKMALGYLLVEYILPIVGADDLKTILSGEFLRCFILNLSNTKHQLHNQAKKLATSMVEILENKDEDSQFSVAEALTMPPGSIAFDEMTKTKLLSGILGLFGENSVSTWCKKLMEIFYTKDDPVFYMRQPACIRQLSGFFKSRQLCVEPKERDQYLKFLLLHAYFDVATSNKDAAADKIPISKRLREVLKIGFAKSLESVCRYGTKTTKERVQHEAIVMAEIRKYVCTLIQSESNTLVVPGAENFFTAIKEKAKELGKQKLSPDLKAAFDHLFNIITLMGLQNPVEAESAMDELLECSKHVNDKQRPDIPFWKDVLTDLMISCLAHCSSEVSNLLRSPYEAISPKITKASSKIIHDALLSTTLDDSEDEEDDDSDEDDLKNSEGSQKEESEEESEEESDEEELPEADEKLKNDLKTALGEAADVESDEEEVLMNDDEMFNIDDTLADIFRARFRASKAGKAQEAENSKKMLCDFKLRICNLVDMLLKNQMSLECLLEITPALVTLSRCSSEQKSPLSVLGNRAIRLLDEISKVKHVEISENTDGLADQLKGLLELTLTVCRKSANEIFQKCLGRIFAWTVETAQTVCPSSTSHEEIVCDALKSFFTSPVNHLTAHMFTRMMSVEKNLTMRMVRIILDSVFAEKTRRYVKSFGLDLLASGIQMLRKSNSLEDELSKEIEPKLISAIEEHLKSESMKISYISELLHCLAVLRDNQQLLGDNYAEIREALTKVKRKSLSKSGRNAIAKLIKLQQPEAKRTHNGSEKPISPKKAKVSS